MKYLIVASMLLVGVGCSAQIPDVKPESLTQNLMSDIEPAYLVGGWEVLTSKTDGFDSIILKEDGTYFTHLNERPFDEGSWEYDGETLTLTSNANEKLNFAYTNLDRKGGEYLLLDRVDLEGEDAERTWEKQ